MELKASREREQLLEKDLQEKIRVLRTCQDGRRLEKLLEEARRELSSKVNEVEELQSKLREQVGLPPEQLRAAATRRGRSHHQMCVCPRACLIE